MWIKYVHLVTVVLSFAGFFLRGLMRLRDSPWLRHPFVRVAPHVNDTLLLAAGVTLAWRIQQYPFVHGWLTAKLVGLLAYIGLGMVALRFGRTRRVRLAAWVAALAVYLYIVGVALTRDPALGLAQLT